MYQAHLVDECESREVPRSTVILGVGSRYEIGQRRRDNEFSLIPVGNE